MKKICLVIHSLGIGGMERVMAQLANNFANRPNTRVHIILIGKKREVLFELSESITIHKPTFDFKDNRRTFDTLRTIKYLRGKVTNINPDTVLSLGEIWNNLVLLSLYNVDVPIFISDRCQPNKSLGKIHNWLRKKLYPKADGIIAQTTIAKKIYEKKNLNKNIKIIGNPIYNIPMNGKKSKDNIILSVGRLIKSKHHDRLLKIFKNISPEGWKLVIVGGDALQEEGMMRLKKIIAELGLEENVELPGTVLDIASYYNRSKIFVFTSSSEGFPNVIGEAMSAGLPVISYNCVAGPSDMIIDGYDGFLIPLFDDELFAQKLKYLINNENKRKKMGKHAKKSADKFSANKTAEQYYTFLLN
jgi:GalNAc-alpha-(1->4)-GalNAc-alpha-(1->3)-diNAcBac-PP-undecaprenol alpha-1,4-N-acetyl-D-galactosaminyltransferase